MKVYCFLFDACHDSEEVRQFFVKNKMNYKICITNSFTTSSLVSCFSGLLPSQITKRGIGYGSIYANSTEKEKREWDSKIVFNQFPEDWKIYIHGDDKNYKFLTTECCSISRDCDFYIHKNYSNEIENYFKMRNLSNKENHFMFFKYNHLHDAFDCNSETFGKEKKATRRFIEILESIDFQEEESFFWMFADHGNWKYIDQYMTPPHSCVCWSSVVNNIDNTQNSQTITHITDFYHYVNKIVFNKEPEFVKDYYYCEDGRQTVDKNSTTTFSVLKEYNKDVLHQLSYHKNQNKFSFFRYDHVKKRLLSPSKDVTREEILFLRKKLFEVYGSRINE